MPSPRICPMGSSRFDTEPSAAVEHSRHQLKTYTRSEPFGTRAIFICPQSHTRQSLQSKIEKNNGRLAGPWSVGRTWLRLAPSEWRRSQFHRQLRGNFFRRRGLFTALLKRDIFIFRSKKRIGFQRLLSVI